MAGEKTKQPTRRMHYLPCVLLSRFGEGVGREAVVWVWDKDTGKVRRSRVEAEGYQNDLYLLPREAVEAIKDQPVPPRYKEAHGWEEMFQAVETSFSRLLDSITSSAHLPDKGSAEMWELLHAILLMSARTPARMSEIRSLTELLYNQVAKIEDPHDSDLQIEVPFKQNRHIFLGQAMRSIEPLYEVIKGMGWSLRVTLGTEYVIGDYPLRWVFARSPDSEFDSPVPKPESTAQGRRNPPAK
jgi:hypothetical protein